MTLRPVRRARKGLKKHPMIRELLSLLLILGAVYLGVKGAMILSLQTTSPMMGVSGTSMTHEDSSWKTYYYDHGAEPSSFPFKGGLNPGDLILVRGIGSINDVEIGDVVIWDKGKGATIHRVAKINLKNDYIRTKGDHNPVLDYEIIHPKHIVGKAIVSIPYLGFPALWGG